MRKRILRAHHGMCLAFFEGKGYSQAFSEHMASVLEMMQKNPKLQIVAEKDMICRKCPNLEEDLCSTPDMVRHYDRQVLNICGLEEGCELSWNDFSDLVINHIVKAGKREEICGDCCWTEICKSKEDRYLF